MKKLATAIAAIALIGTPALAADMAVKAPPPAPAPVYSWTGWYAGVNAGASMGNVKTNLNGSPVSAFNIFRGVSGAVPFQVTSGFAFPNDRTYPDGFIGGGQIGYNWEVSPLFVLGFEADIQGALEKDSSNNLTQNVDFLILGRTGNVLTACGTAGVTAPTFPTHCTAATSYTTQIDWFGTVRARLGYVWGNGEVLSYVTGGLAYGEVKINGASSVSGPVFSNACTACEFTFSQTQTIGQSHVNTGWVLGYGTEGHLPLMPGNWTWKIETLYMDLGHLNATSSTSGSSCAVVTGVTGTTCSVTGGQVTTHSHFTDGILRAGLNYQFH
jgi:outer membrane immunogenic protein